MARLRRRVAGASLALVSGVALAACTGDKELPAREPAAVKLSVDKLPDRGATIGLLVSSSSPRGEGADYTGPSAGAELAAYRLRLGGDKVALTVVDDRGSSDDAVAAIKTFVDAGAAGVVVATSGTHVLPALRAAADADLPVVAPYLRTTEDLPAGVHVTGPSEAQVTDGIKQAMRTDEVDSPVVLTADDVPVPDVDGKRVAFTGSKLDDIVDDISDEVEDDKTDSVVVSASAGTEAAIVAALQGAVPDLPVYLTPEAMTPAFTTALGDGEGTPSGRFVSVGPQASDASTLGRDAAADSAAAYFAALRLAAADTTFTSGLDNAPFSELSGAADLPSHDAVVALVQAVARAGSAEPAKVTAALDGLKVGVKQSLAGPALDLSQPYALPDASVEPLYATTQDPGVRPAADATTLTWFRLPDDAT